MKQSLYMEWAKTRSSAKYNLATSGVIECSFADLHASSNDFELRRPPGYTYSLLQQALAEKCGVPEECVVTAIGTSFANYLAMALLIDAGDEVLIEHPIYDPMLSIAQYLRADIKRFHRRFENQFRIDIDEVRRLATARTKLIILTNLHNPSSAFVDEETLKALQQIARETGARVLVDEVYLELFPVAGRPFKSSFLLGPEFIVTSSLTKAYGLSGLRCGWILAEPSIARRLWQFNDLFYATPPHITERLSVIALNEMDAITERARALLEANRPLLDQFLDANADKLEVVRTEIGTVVFPRPTRISVESLCETLRNKYETSIVPGGFFEMPDHFRLGIGGLTDNLQEGLHRLGEVL